MEDRWLPTLSTYKVISPPSLLGVEARVNELIDQDTSSWNAELIREVFLPHEVETILGLVRSSCLPKDRLFWATSSNGRFLVCSAYTVAMDMKEERLKGVVSDDSRLRHFWKTLWGLNIPPKVHHFAWRVCKDILPTKENLTRRRCCWMVNVRYVMRMWSHWAIFSRIVPLFLKSGMCRSCFQ